jgi:ABC-type spermidine/putrescine transport system permease subunit I
VPGRTLEGAGGPVSARSRIAWLRPRTPAADAVGVRPAVLLALPVLAAVAFLLLPLLALGERSLSEQGLGGVPTMLGNDLFLDAVQRTLVLSLTVAVLCWLIGTVYAVALVVAPRPLALVLLAILFTTFWISGLVRTFGWVLLFEPNGVLDQQLRSLGLIDQPLDLLQTTPAMYPAMVHVMLPFYILPVYAACLRLDPNLLRAAQSLGARPHDVLRRVILPALKPSILAGATLVFILSLAFYVTPLLLGGPEDLTIATLISREFSEIYDLGSAATMALILLAVVLVLYLLVDRFVSLIPDLGTDS